MLDYDEKIAHRCSVESTLCRYFYHGISIGIDVRMLYFWLRKKTTKQPHSSLFNPMHYRRGLQNKVGGVLFVFVFLHHLFDEYIFIPIFDQRIILIIYINVSSEMHSFSKIFLAMFRMMP